MRRGGASGEPPSSPETSFTGPLARTGGFAAGVVPAERPGLRTVASRLALDLTPLRRHPAFRRLWLAQGISFIGTEIAEVALAYQVYQLTGSTLAVGLIALTHFVPRVDADGTPSGRTSARSSPASATSGVSR